jgi:hypothetical protein
MAGMSPEMAPASAEAAESNGNGHEDYSSEEFSLSELPAP